MLKKMLCFFSLILTLSAHSQNKICLSLINRVSEDSLRKYEYTLASELFGGRRTHTDKGLLTSNYISTKFRSIGLKAPFGSSYTQIISIPLKPLHSAPPLIDEKISNNLNNVSESNFAAQNIIGILQGRNSRESHLVITAHHDHMGRSEDGILYGADDNGSGISALIEVSRILSEAAKQGIRSKRTIVFVSTDAEEKKLVGSDYYVNNPVIPISKTYCNVNFDMIGRIDSTHLVSKSLNNYIYCIYKDTTNQVFNDLYLNNLNEKYTQLILDERYEKEAESIVPYSLITRSDHYPFMKKGIPSIWLFSGFHDDYHQITDTPDKICYPELKKRVQFVLALVWNLANK